MYAGAALVAVAGVAFLRDPAMFYPSRQLTEGERRWNRGVALAILLVVVVGLTAATTQFAS